MRLTAITLLAFTFVAMTGTKFVQASHLNGQINELAQDNAQNQQEQAVLEVEAANLADKVARLQSEING